MAESKLLSAGPEDVACDFCTGTKRKAAKSCLCCVVSYCEEHLRPHHEVTQFKKHKLVEPYPELQESVCTHHDKVRNIFCRTDKACICYLCLDEHKKHDTVSAEAEMISRKEKIGPRRQKIKEIIQDTEKKVTALEQEVETINRSAEKAVTDSQKMSSDLIPILQRLSSQMTKKIRCHQETEVSRAKKLQEQLTERLTELRSTDAELEKLSQTEDQTQFLHKYVSLPSCSKHTALPVMNKGPRRYFEDVTAAVTEARKSIVKCYCNEWKQISMRVTDVDVLLPQDPKTRAECLRFAVHSSDFKLDPNTANMMIVLSEDHRKATLSKNEQPYSGHSERFDTSQVLTVKPLTGRHYWEVKWTGLGGAVAVAYKDIAREGDESIFGNSDKSWVLKYNNGTYTFKHDGSSEKLPSPVLSPTVGVFLDSKAGILSFYEVKDTITRLHTVKTKFTQPLYAGLGVYLNGSTAEFCVIN